MTEKEKKTEVITASMFYKYNACPHWLYFDRYGKEEDRSELSDFNKRLLEMGIAHEEDVLEGMEFERVEGETLEERFEATKKLMEEGATRIYHGILMTEDMVGEPDILEKRYDQSSNFGSYYYTAIDIKSAERVTDPHKYQLVFYGELLKEVQGTRPKEGYILNKSGVQIGFPIREFERQFHDALRSIKGIFDGRKPSPLVSSSCKNSPWFSECIAYAEETNDIALLYNVRRKTLGALRRKGITTIEHAAKMNVDALADTYPTFTRKTLSRIVLQAKALTDHEYHIRKPHIFHEEELEIFFDIEGDPMRQVEYLFGFLVRQGGTEEYKRFLAEQPKDEGTMWREFLDWVAGLPPQYAVYHYGTYEQMRLKSMRDQYGGSDSLIRFIDRMVDLNEIVKNKIVFPLYFYGIKDIGGYIGFERGDTIASGGESIAFYEDWVENGNRQALDDVIEYNKDDVIATRYLKDWLSNAFKTPEEE